MLDCIGSKVEKLNDGRVPWYTWNLTVQGSCTEVECRPQIPFQSRTPIRGPIRKFSNAARMRMRRECARIDWERAVPALFITLTTPDEVADSSPAERTRQRESFQRRMEKFLGKKVSALWRIEWVRRRSGKLKGKLIHHFHLIVCNVQYIPWQEIRRWWALSIGHDGILKTWVERIQSPLQCAAYLCKYMSKVPSLDYAPYLRKDESIGRQWGMLRTRQIPRKAKQRVFHLWEEDVDFLVSIGIEKIKDFGRYGPMSFTLFGDDVREACEIYFEKRLETIGESS